MKKIILFAALVCSLQAVPYQFTLTGVTNYSTLGGTLANGTTFTAQFVVDTSAADSNADPAIGNYTQGGASTVLFSNGLTLGGGAFDYVVGNDLFIPPLNDSFDVLAFYYYPSGLSLGFEFRLPLGTFTSDAAQVPLGPIPLNSQDWFYSPGQGFAGGSITSIEVSSVPEGGSTLGCLALTSVLWLFRRKVRRE